MRPVEDVEEIWDHQGMLREHVVEMAGLARQRRRNEEQIRRMEQEQIRQMERQLRQHQQLQEAQELDLLPLQGDVPVIVLEHVDVQVQEKDEGVEGSEEKDKGVEGAKEKDVEYYFDK